MRPLICAVRCSSGTARRHILSPSLRLLVDGNITLTSCLAYNLALDQKSGGRESDGSSQSGTLLSLASKPIPAYP